MEPARFCSRCGQRTDTARLSFGDVVRDLMHKFGNVERSPPAFARSLLTRPGGVAREYVEGKRRRHYGPFATLVVLVGVTALAVNWSGFQILLLMAARNRGYSPRSVGSGFQSAGSSPDPVGRFGF